MTRHSSKTNLLLSQNDPTGLDSPKNPQVPGDSPVPMQNGPSGQNEGASPQNPQVPRGSSDTLQTTPSLNSIFRSNTTLLMKTRDYDVSYTGNCVMILDSKNDKAFSDRDLGHILQPHRRAVKEFRKTGRYRYTVITENYDTYQQIKNMDNITKHFEVTVPSATTEFLGVIKTESEENLIDIFDPTQNPDVNTIRYITKRDGNDKVKTSFVKIYFHQTHERKDIYIGQKLYKIEEYLPKIKACHHCFRYGHLIFSCKAQARCRQCGNPSKSHICHVANIRCLGCGRRDHLFGSRICPLLHFLTPYAKQLHMRTTKISTLMDTFRNGNRSAPPRDHSRFSQSHPCSGMDDFPPLQQHLSGTGYSRPNDDAQASQNHPWVRMEDFPPLHLQRSSQSQYRTRHSPPHHRNKHRGPPNTRNHPSQHNLNQGRNETQHESSPNFREETNSQINPERRQNLLEKVELSKIMLVLTKTMNFFQNAEFLPHNNTTSELVNELRVMLTTIGSNLSSL